MNSIGIETLARRTLDKKIDSIEANFLKEMAQAVALARKTYKDRMTSAWEARDLATVRAWNLYYQEVAERESEGEDVNPAP